LTYNQPHASTEYGQPFTVNGFGGFMRDAIKAAGLPLECQPHGLRKTAGRCLAEAGCTAHEIMSVLGLRTLSEAERYSRGAEQCSLSASAVTKLERCKRNTVSQTAPNRVGKIEKMEGKTKC
jgi:integrase